MKVLFSEKSESQEGAQIYYNWKEWETEKSNLLYCYGIDSGYRMPRPDGFENKIYFECEEPNGFTFGQLPQNRGNWEFDYWTKIYHTCPYCVKWENKIYNTNKFELANHYFNTKYHLSNEKEYSACYIGGLHSHIPHNLFFEIASEVSQIPNSRIVSYTSHPIVTDHNVNYFKKLEINSKTKISVVANLLQQTSDATRQANSIAQLPNYKENEAFKLIEYGLMPQIKNRVIEAAAMKSLVLVMYDEWNVIEHFYSPNTHFLYFNKGELKARILECLDNWDYCEKIIENMYNHYLSNYTMEKFYEKHLKKFDT